MEVERSGAEITKMDLDELRRGSESRRAGKKWGALYDIGMPLAIALCQGAAMHYHDKVNGIKDFDVWFFYPFNEKHLPYRVQWNWDYQNKKFGRHPDISGYAGRKVDVMVRSIHHYQKDKPAETISQYLELENT